MLGSAMAQVSCALAQSVRLLVGAAPTEHYGLPDMNFTRLLPNRTSGAWGPLSQSPRAGNRVSPRKNAAPHSGTAKHNLQYGRFFLRVQLTHGDRLDPAATLKRGLARDP